MKIPCISLGMMSQLFMHSCSRIGSIASILIFNNLMVIVRIKSRNTNIHETYLFRIGGHEDTMVWICVRRFIIVNYSKVFKEPKKKKFKSIPRRNGNRNLSRAPPLAQVHEPDYVWVECNQTYGIARFCTLWRWVWQVSNTVRNPWLLDSKNDWLFLTINSERGWYSFGSWIFSFSFRLVSDWVRLYKHEQNSESSDNDCHLPRVFNLMIFYEICRQRLRGVSFNAYILYSCISFGLDWNSHTVVVKASRNSVKIVTVSS